MRGTVFNIQRFSIHDGPGIRTTVFLKGCNLRCAWCHNPESFLQKPQLQFFPQKCIGCGECFAVCPAGAHELDHGAHLLNREKCTVCGRCADTCYAESLVVVGKEMTVDEVLGQVAQDAVFYETSQGGVTFSGGEPLLQPEFLRSLLEGSKEIGLHTAVDTAGSVQETAFSAILPHVDLFLFDIKLADDVRHRQYTGVSNRQVLDNLAFVSRMGGRIWVRIPLVPGVNDTPNDILMIADHLRPLEGVELVELLPFHRMAEGKYRSLALDPPPSGFRTPDAGALDSLTALLCEMGLPAKHS